MKLPYDKYHSPAYWTTLIQMSLYDHIKRYLEETDMSRKEFAEKLGVSKGYVSQIMNGDFDHKLSKLVELALACDLVPEIEMKPMAMARNVENTYLNPKDWRNIGEFSQKIKDNIERSITANISMETLVEVPTVKIELTDEPMDNGSKIHAA